MAGEGAGGRGQGGRRAGGRGQGAAGAADAPLGQGMRVGATGEGVSLGDTLGLGYAEHKGAAAPVNESGRVRERGA